MRAALTILRSEVNHAQCVASIEQREARVVDEDELVMLLGPLHAILARDVGDESIDRTANWVAGDVGRHVVLELVFLVHAGLLRLLPSCKVQVHKTMRAKNRQLSFHSCVLTVDSVDK